MSDHDASDHIIGVVHSEYDECDALVDHHKRLYESKQVKPLFIEVQANDKDETSVARPEEITLFDITVEETGKAGVLPVIAVREGHDEHLLGLRMLTYMIAQVP